MEKIDNRRHYVLMLDTETANTLTITIPAKYDDDGNEIYPERESLDMSSTLMYDCGWAVIDTAGHLYETASYVNRDIFVYERDLMQSAYYADKIPRYVEDLKAGRRKMANTWEIRQAMLETLDRYNIVNVCAHNARFDYNTLNTIQRFVTCSKYRYWFPFERVVFWDTLKMSQDVICSQTGYKEFCQKYGYISPHNGAPRKTAEILYRYISGNYDFKESHTGLEDVLIEAEILWHCFRQHKPMRKELFPPKEWPEITPFQRKMLANIRQNPTINMR